MKQEQLPKILALLQEDSGVNVTSIGTERGFNLFMADLTEWRLRFSDKSPFIVVQESDLRDDLEQTWDAILELVTVRRWQHSIPVVIVEGNGECLKQKVAMARQTHFTMGVMDDQVAEAMTAARSRRYPFLDALLAQTQRRALLPYETSSPVIGSAFFNRQSEVRNLAQSNANYAITGVRRIGKTSLIMETMRRLEMKDNCVLLICNIFHSLDEFKRELIRALRPIELRHLDHYLFSFSDFLQRMPKYKKGRIDLFLDEVDDLIQMDREQSYEIFGSLRDASIATNLSWRFIMAGSTTLEDECGNNRSPLHNMVRQIALKPFTHSEAEALIRQPFEMVRVKINNPTEVINRIYRETGGHPNLIQHYCILLADILEEESRDFIDARDLSRVYTSMVFRNYVLRSFEINAGPMERLVVYLLANQDEFTQQDIDALLKKEKIFATFFEIDTACENLEKIAVLRKVGRSYQFSLPLLPVMLKQNYDIDYLVTKAREELQG